MNKSGIPSLTKTSKIQSLLSDTVKKVNFKVSGTVSGPIDIEETPQPCQGCTKIAGKSCAPGTAKKFNTTEKVVKKEVEAQMETLSDAHQSGSLDGK